VHRRAQRLIRNELKQTSSKPDACQTSNNEREIPQSFI
jgi:hypothetical protein